MEIAIQASQETEANSERVAAAILEYVQVHVDAADSACGIRDWWLDHRQLGPIALDVVDQALEALVADGWLQRTLTADGVAIYSNARQYRPVMRLVFN